MSGPLAFRLAAAGFALLAILVAALQARRPAPSAPAAAPIQAPRPVDAQLARCQTLGAAGAQDPQCLKAWDEARARFLGAPKAER
ncbi:putative entry exclusion protein TrbK-alt [Caulobacter segnis]|uniref:putative entry exclusion protein TrbK-alt n=1 Tax=Caulobacter segnis TaxID=88688 RepID=UPI00285DBDFD|nr:putative entry exclusion protein TrbK-alt [Caulobacter segnis]MDR6624447.1 conjugative transfer region protein TrbK [Caulobacter segnis]